MKRCVLASRNDTACPVKQGSVSDTKEVLSGGHARKSNFKSLIGRLENLIRNTGGNHNPYLLRFLKIISCFPSKEEDKQ